MLQVTVKSYAEAHLCPSRTVYPVSPPRVEYKLTRVGRSALRPITQLMKWALKQHSQIEKSRSRYDASTNAAARKP